MTTWNAGPTAVLPVTAPPRSRLFMPFAEFEQRALEAEGEPSWLVEGLIPKKGIVMLVGDSLSGKSITLSIIVAATQAEYEEDALFMGLRVSEAKVLYLHLEHQGSTLSRALRAAAKARNATIDAGGLLVGTTVDLDSAEAVEEMALELDREGIDVLIIDPLRRATLGDENASNVTSDWGRQFRRLSGDGRRLVLVVHHQARNSKGPRGSTDLKAQADTLICLSKSNGVTTLEAEHHDGPPKTVSFSLTWDAQENTLNCGPPSREAEASRFVRPTVQIDEDVYETVRASPGLTTSLLRDAVRARRGTARHPDVDAARDRLQRAGRIRFVPQGNAHRWFIVEQVTP